MGGCRAGQLKEQERKPLISQCAVSGIREGPTVCQLTVRVLFGPEAAGIGAWGSGGATLNLSQGARTQTTAAPGATSSGSPQEWRGGPECPFQAGLGPGNIHAGPLSWPLLPDP